MNPIVQINTAENKKEQRNFSHTIALGNVIRPLKFNANPIIDI